MAGFLQKDLMAADIQSLNFEEIEEDLGSLIGQQLTY